MTSTGRTNALRSPELSPAPVLQVRRREAWLVSADDSLLIELGPLLGDRYRTHPVESLDMLARVPAGGWLLLLDAASLRDPAAMATRMAARHPQVPLIVFCADGQAGFWRGMPGARTVCAVLERRQVSEHTVTPALAEADRRLDAAATATTSTALPALGTAPPASPWRDKRAWSAAGAVLVVALATWLVLRGRGHPGNPAATAGTAQPSVPAANASRAAPVPAARVVAPVVAPAATPTRSVSELLSDARSAFRDERTQLPRAEGSTLGDSALELYQQVLVREPQNEEARDGLRRLLAVTRDRVQTDLNTDRLDEAARLLAAYRSAGLGNDELARLASQVSSARPRQLLQRARTALGAGDLAGATNLATQAASAGADATQLAALHRDLATRGADLALAGLAAQARAAIAAGALLDPPAESARAHWQAMQQSARGQPLTNAVAHELQVALIARAQLATHGNDPHQAEPWLAAAAELGAAAELQAAQRELQAALDEQARRALASTPAPRAAAPVPAAPAATWLAAHPRRPLSMAYPEAARAKGISGQVVVEFTLGEDGRPLAPHVVEATPAGMFEAAALASVRTGNFDVTPPAGQGQLGQHARLRINFRYQDSAPGR